jgi:hypothetical protein
MHADTQVKLNAWQLLTSGLHVNAQVKLDALPPSASYHRGASNDDEETTQLDGKKPVSAH